MSFPHNNSSRPVYTKHRRVELHPLTYLVLPLPLTSSLCSHVRQEEREECVMPGLSSYCCVSVMGPIRKVGLYFGYVVMKCV